MRTTQLIDLHNGVPDVSRLLHANAAPRQTTRAALDVSLTGATADISRANLAILLRSPLGVYVSHTELLRDSVHVRFDIAPEDLTCTLHTLLATLPEATIGAVEYHDCRECEETC
jgi:hypothetical protein